MSIENNLTYIQKTALKGEIAYAISTSSHNADIKYRLYLILKEVEDVYKPFILEAFKESVTFDESIIDRIYLETLMGQVPTWLWIEKVIADIEFSIKSGDTNFVGAKLDIDKIQEKKKIVESAFIQFIRTAILVSPSATEQLLNKILEEEPLSFLNVACFYLKNLCNEVIKNHSKETKVKAEIMELEFDIRGMLRVSAEMEDLEELQKSPLKNRKPIRTESPKNNNSVKNETIIIEGSITPNELSEYLSQKVIELFNSAPNEHSHSSNNRKNSPSSNKKIKYVVEKVFHSSNIKTDIRTCDTEEEAIEFIQKIREEYPELQSTCDFIIRKQI
jgi:hypothetical protein